MYNDIITDVHFKNEFKLNKLKKGKLILNPHLNIEFIKNYF